MPGPKYSVMRSRSGAVGIATSADVEALQQSVSTRAEQIETSVNACAWVRTAQGTTTNPVYDQWMQEYEKARAYVNMEPSFFSAGTQVAQGQALLKELDTWAATIAAQPECKGVAMPPAPPPPVPTQPGSITKSLSDWFSGLSMIEIAVGVYLLSQWSKRGR